MRILVHCIPGSLRRAALPWLLGSCLPPLAACSVDSRVTTVAQLSAASTGGDVSGGGGASGFGGLPGITPCAADCAAITCPADDVCRDYVDGIPAGSCHGDGSCATADDCSFSWKPAAPDGVGCECGAGGCRLTTGASCTAPDACASTSCLATNAGTNLCCAVACPADQACTADGSGCEPLQACTEDARRCTGASFQQCAQGAWVTLAECGALGCSVDRGGCLRSLGQACAANEDCGEGSCAETPDGSRVCCTASCDGPCKRCAASGTECAPLEDDAACGSIECPTDDPCRLYETPSVDAARCVDGACATPQQACAFTPQNENQECDPSTLCDDAGNCSRPKLATNAPCSGAAECQSGACVASAAGGSVCCASACTPNQQCGASGECELAPVCEDGSTQCSGSSFQRCNAGQWVLDTDCGTVGCSEAVGGCLAGAGDDCASDADCGEGRCQPTPTGARVCCTAPCSGECRRCAPSGVACEALDDDPACGIVSCPASTTCRTFPSSVSSGRCVDGRCGSPGQLCGAGTPRNPGAVCSPTSLCDTAGNCSQPRLNVGSACGDGDECLTGFCVDGVCCNEACDRDCESCGSGICSFVPDDDACGDVSCSRFNAACVVNATDFTASTRDRCRDRGVCKSEADCGFQPARTSCNSFIIQACDGRGGCNPVTLPCGGACEEGLNAFDACCSFADTLTIECIDTFTCTNGTTNFPIRCFDHLDCALGQLCCLAGGGTQVECETPEFCDQQLCASPTRAQTAVDCPGGTSCVPSANPLLGSFSFCQ